MYPQTMLKFIKSIMNRDPFMETGSRKRALTVAAFDAAATTIGVVAARLAGLVIRAVFLAGFGAGLAVAYMFMTNRAMDGTSRPK